MDPTAPKLPTWTLQGRCLLRPGHLGDWEKPPLNEAHITLRDDLSYARVAPPYSTDYDFNLDMLTSDTPIEHWAHRLHEQCPYNVLLASSGEGSSPHSLATQLRMRGMNVIAYDLKIRGRVHDLTKDEVVNNVVRRIRGESSVLCSPRHHASLSASPRRTRARNCDPKTIHTDYLTFPLSGSNTFNGTTQWLRQQPES